MGEHRADVKVDANLRWIGSPPVVLQAADCAARPVCRWWGRGLDADGAAP